MVTYATNVIFFRIAMVLFFQVCFLTVHDQDIAIFRQITNHKVLVRHKDSVFRPNAVLFRILNLKIFKLKH